MDEFNRKPSDKGTGAAATLAVLRKAMFFIADLAFAATRSIWKSPPFVSMDELCSRFQVDQVIKVGGAISVLVREMPADFSG